MYDMYNPKTKPYNPYTAPASQFKQPYQSWQTNRPSPGNSKKNKRTTKVNQNFNWAYLSGNPYINTAETVQAGKDALTAGQTQGQKLAESTARQNAARTNTTYGGVGADIARQRTEDNALKAAIQGNQMDERARRENREGLLNVTGMISKDRAMRKQLATQQLTQEQAQSAARAGRPETAKGKVICSELYRQGLMPYDIYEADEDYGEYLKRERPIDIYGYQAWAIPCVKLMKKSLFLSKVALFIAMPWAKHMAYLMKPEEFKPNFIGSCMVKIGLPACYLIGKLKLSLNSKCEVEQWLTK